jgi:transmembrane sensor
MEVQRQIDRLLALRASEWLEVLQHGGERERGQFVDWLSESRLHVQEMLEIVAVDRELSRLDPQRREDVQALLRKIAPRVATLQESGAAATPSTARVPARARWLTAAAGLAAAALGAMWWLWAFDRAESYATVTGEQRAVELADASLAHLNADTRIEVRMGDDAREVRLLRGEALFKVSHDAARPFRVHARGGVVQAIGTQFNVYARPEGTRVSVLEGRVRVMAEASAATGEPVPPPQALTLAAGEEALIGLDGALSRVASPDIEDAVAWRQRRLVFEDAPLEEIVREFNRYSRAHRLRLEGVEPGSHRYDGTFDADDPGSLAAMLGRESDLEVRSDRQGIVIRGRREAPLQH